MYDVLTSMNHTPTWFYKHRHIHTFRELIRLFYYQILTKKDDRRHNQTQTIFTSSSRVKSPAAPPALLTQWRH